MIGNCLRYAGTPRESWAPTPGEPLGHTHNDVLRKNESIRATAKPVCRLRLVRIVEICVSGVSPHVRGGWIYEQTEELEEWPTNCSH